MKIVIFRRVVLWPSADLARRHRRHFGEGAEGLAALGARVDVPLDPGALVVLELVPQEPERLLVIEVSHGNAPPAASLRCSRSTATAPTR